MFKVGDIVTFKDDVNTPVLFRGSAPLLFKVIVYQSHLPLVHLIDCKYNEKWLFAEQRMRHATREEIHNMNLEMSKNKV